MQKSVFLTSRFIWFYQFLSHGVSHLIIVKYMVSSQMKAFYLRGIGQDLRLYNICYILQIYGEGDQTWSFQYVSDLVDGLIALMNSNYSQPVNLGNPDEYTIRQFADIIKKYVGKSLLFFTTWFKTFLYSLKTYLWSLWPGLTQIGL